MNVINIAKLNEKCIQCKKNNVELIKLHYSHRKKSIKAQTLKKLKAQLMYSFIQQNFQKLIAKQCTSATQTFHIPTYC